MFFLLGVRERARRLRTGEREGAAAGAPYWAAIKRVVRHARGCVWGATVSPSSSSSAFVVEERPLTPIEPFAPAMDAYVTPATMPHSYAIQ